MFWFNFGHAVTAGCVIRITLRMSRMLVLSWEMACLKLKYVAFLNYITPLIINFRFLNYVLHSIICIVLFNYIPIWTKTYYNRLLLTKLIFHFLSALPLLNKGKINVFNFMYKCVFSHLFSVSMHGDGVFYI